MKDKIYTSDLEKLILLAEDIFGEGISLTVENKVTVKRKWEAWKDKFSDCTFTYSVIDNEAVEVVDDCPDWFEEEK